MINSKLILNPNQELPHYWTRKEEQFYFPGEETLVYDQSEFGLNIAVLVRVRTNADLIPVGVLGNSLWEVIEAEVDRRQSENLDSSCYGNPN